ncbi:MAG: serine hydrolase domain-containing protein [Bacteroidota bacterium]
MRMQQVLLILPLLFTINLFGQTTPEIDSEAITAIVQQYVDEGDPGLAVGIVQDGEIVYEQYVGYANLEHKVAINENTRFNIASTAKQFTALIILDLALKGKLSLEDDIRKYVPSLYPEVEEEIKLRHLINHTAGIRDYTFLYEIMEKPYWQQVGTDNDDIIELLERQEDLVFTPSTKYLYSNSGYILLTQVVEVVTGESFNDYSEQFFAEMGMNKTAFVRRYLGLIPNRADAYSDWGGGSWFADLAVTKSNGDGFLYTTLQDQLTYEQAVQQATQNNNELLIKSQQPIPNSEITEYGFGLELDNRLGRVAQSHSGSTFGFNAHTSRFSEDRLTVVVMSNNGKIWSENVVYKIASAVLPNVDTKPVYDPQLSSSELAVEPAQITGQYLSSFGDLIRIEEEEGKLLWKYGAWNPDELVREGENQFAVSYNTRIKFRFNENEVVKFYPGGTAVTYTKTSYEAASLADLEGFVGKYHSSELEMDFEIRLTEEHELKLLFSNQDEEFDVEVLNRNELLADYYNLKVERDRFGRAADILVTLSRRARKNRFRKETNLVFQPKIETDNGTIQVTTIGSRSGDASDILLTKNEPNGNEIWFEQFGGASYDKASSLLATDDGYLIVGSTSSYGNGNYDILVIKTDKQGKKQWQSTYGGFYNEYGYVAEETAAGFLIKGTIQDCTSNSDVFNRECKTNVWLVQIDKEGKELSTEILEEL